MSTALLEPPRRTECDSESLTEYVDGLEVELPAMSNKAMIVQSRLHGHLNSFAFSARLGECYIEPLIAMKLASRSRERRPDFAYISYEKWPRDAYSDDDRAWDIVPDICVEVVSPSDKSDDIDGKIEEYFETGVRQVWVVYPKKRRIRVYRSPNDEQTLSIRDTLTCPEILPGYELRLADIFPK